MFSRETRDVPHVFHLLMTVLCCGTWLVVWLLHILFHSFSRQPLFRCNQCGQAEGELTEEQEEEKREIREQKRRAFWARMRQRAAALGYAIDTVTSPLITRVGAWFAAIPDDWRKVDERPWTAMYKTLVCALLLIGMAIWVFIVVQVAKGWLR
jgi:hypothetical protein